MRLHGVRRLMVALREAPAQRMPRVRLSVRGAMILVMVAAVTFWLGMSRERRLSEWQYHSDRAGRERVIVDQEMDTLKMYQDSVPNGRAIIDRLMVNQPGSALLRKYEKDHLAFLGRIAEQRQKVEHHRELREYHEILKQKYGDAARHPWLPVNFDPREPK